MKKKLLSVLVIALFLFCISGMANATLMSCSKSGNRILTIAPVSVADDNPGAENTYQQAFDEKQNVTLTSNLFVNGGFIAAGTVVSSHMIFLNTKGTGRIIDSGVEWTFAGQILGVMSDNHGDMEAASNSLLGLANTYYPGAFNNRGLEQQQSGITNFDGYTFTGNSITLAMRVTEPGDWIRVVTASPTVPIPAAVWLFGSGLLGLLGVRRRKK